MGAWQTLLSCFIVLTYDPRLPRLSTILSKHWQTMVQDPHLKEVFPKPKLRKSSTQTQ